MKSDKRKRPRSKGRAGAALILGLVWLGLAGCYPPSALEQDYGQSVANNLAQQVVNPRAGLDPVPSVGLAPTAGATAYEAYTKSFKPEDKKGIELKALSPY